MLYSACGSTINGREIAIWLAEKLGHENVYYIGLPSHPQYELACRQMSGFGGMISIELGTWARAAHLLGKVRVFALAESLGGVESLISQPAGMTHASVPPERRAAMGLSDGLVRLSCGVEDVEICLLIWSRRSTVFLAVGGKGSGKRAKSLLRHLRRACA
jgi:cystathionine beta-lyase/cystathionine gamma-synthase